MLNSLLRASGKGSISESGSANQIRQVENTTKDSLGDPYSMEEDSNQMDFARSNSLYERYLSNLDNILDVSPMIFNRRVAQIQNEIDSPDLQIEETDRLLLLKAVLHLFYYDQHYLDEDYDEHERDYLSIIDEVDDLIKSMSDLTQEGACVYYIANMFSIFRFENITPLDKLEELWNDYRSLNLKDCETEFKASFWDETAQRIHDMMKRIATPDNNQTASGYDKVFDNVKKIIVKKLSVEPSEVTPRTQFSELGCDSLDFVELMMELEKQFGITIPEHEADRIKTVKDAVSYIENHI